MTHTTGSRTAPARIRPISLAAAGGALLLGFGLACGCTKTERRVAGTQAAAQASQVATTAVTTTVAGQNPTTRRRWNSGIKPDGRGGFDSSELRAAAQRQAHWMTAHRNEVYRPSSVFGPASRPRPTTGASN